MSMNVIYDLPVELTVSVLDLLGFADLSRLESATVNKSNASSLRNSFKAYHLKSFPLTEGSKCEKRVGWVVQSGIQVDEISLSMQNLYDLALYNDLIYSQSFQNCYIHLMIKSFDVEQVEHLKEVLQDSICCRKITLTIHQPVPYALSFIHILYSNTRILEKSFTIEMIGESPQFFAEALHSLPPAGAAEMVTKIRHDRDPYRRSGHPIYTPGFVFHFTTPLINLTVIEWLGREANPWLPTIIRLSPNLQKFAAEGIFNAIAILQCSSACLSDISFHNFLSSSNDDSVSVDDFFFRLTNMPLFQQSIKYLTIKICSRISSKVIRSLARFTNLQSLSLHAVDPHESDLLFLTDCFNSIEAMRIVQPGLSANAYFHLLTTIQCRNVELSFNPKQFSNIANSESFDLPTSNVKTENLILFWKKCSSAFYSKIFSVFYTLSFTHLCSLDMRCEEMTKDYLVGIQTACPVLHSLSITLVEDRFVLEEFPQDWRCLRSIKIEAEMQVSYDGILTLAASSQTMRRVTLQLMRNSVFRCSLATWKEEMRVQYPKVKFELLLLDSSSQKMKEL